MSIDMALYMRERREKRRQLLRDKLGGVCKNCGARERLEFDHIDPSTKSFTISSRKLDSEWGILLEEVAKCQLLCRTCHLLKTSAESKGKPAHNRGVTYGVCGAGAKYGAGCRCLLCKQWRRDYRRGLVDYSNIPV